MRTGRPKVALIVTDEERHRLTSLAHRARSAPHVARRARIILACTEGTDSQVVARRLHVMPATVCKWRGRFVRQRLDGLAETQIKIKTAHHAEAASDAFDDFFASRIDKAFHRLQGFGEEKQPSHYDFLAPPQGPDEIGRLGAYRCRNRSWSWFLGSHGQATV